MNDTHRTPTVPRRARLVALAIGSIMLVAACGARWRLLRARTTAAAPRLGATLRHRHHRRLEHRLPDHRGRRRGVPEGEPGRQGARSRFSGTGGGFKKFCAGETDINDASRPIKTEDTAEAKSEATLCKEAASSPSSCRSRIDGLTRRRQPVERLGDCLTVAELKTIYGPESTEDLTWADVRAGLPAETIDRYMPGADSGTFDYFTEEINGEIDASDAGRDPVRGRQRAGDRRRRRHERDRLLRLRLLRREHGQAQGRARSTAAPAACAPTRDRSTTAPTRRSAARCSSTRTVARPTRGRSSKAFVDYYLANASDLSPPRSATSPCRTPSSQQTVAALQAAVGS